ncbi:MAG: restriction endonuclease [Clostridia bacterium]|nr:restriction endonuclease [Clostridia bacterium]
MKKTTTRSEQPIVTRAEKKDAVKNLIRELLADRSLKHNDLIEEAANVYAQRFAGEDTENINDVRGRIGSVLDIMKKEEEVLYEGGMYALKTKKTAPKKKKTVEKAAETKKENEAEKSVKSKVKKADEKSGVAVSEGTPMETPKAEEPTEKKPEEKKKTKRSVKMKKTVVETPESEEKKEEEVLPLPPAPLQPIAPVAPVTPEVAPEPMPETKPTEEKPTPKKRGRKAAVKTEETSKTEEGKQEQKTEKDAPMSEANDQTSEEIISEEPKKEQKAEEKSESVALVQKPKAEVATKNVVMDMSFLFGNVQKEEKQPPKPLPKQETPAPMPTPSAPAPSAPAQVKAEVKTEEKPVPKAETKPAAKEDNKSAPKAEEQPVKPVKTVVKTEKTAVQPQADKRRLRVEKAPQKPLTADEKLRDAFLRKIRSLGGDYFEYYSMYLLERYSRRNGRRLEGLKVMGGAHDGGIDGEIELTDRLGFRETIYIQSKNWNPEKGDERLWVVGETLLQQFIGACACRQAKEGKQHCRGIFITTSRFTPDAKRILDTMSDKIVGYDGEDLFEAAKECEFGIVKKNGAWVLDEQLLSGEKAFFNMF